MAQIILSNGQKLTNAAQLLGLPQASTRRMIPADELAARLAELRAEWIEATGGDLESVTVNLAALFDDLDTICKGETQHEPINLEIA